MSTTEEFHYPLTIALLHQISRDTTTSTPTNVTLFSQSVTKIRLEGTIIDTRQTKSSLKITLDDGTGTIQVTIGKFVKLEQSDLQIGKNVGCIGKYKNATKMTATNLFELPSGSSQIVWISKTASFWQQFLV